MDKPKVVLFNQYHRLFTGFSKMGVHFMQRATEKYGDEFEFIEMATESDPNPLDRAVPWEIIHAKEYGASYQGDREDAFGQYAYERVLAEMKPAYVISWRDWWMDAQWALQYDRDKTIYGIMPCVDGMPQPLGWGWDFRKADFVTAYCAFAAARLYEQFGIKVADITSPGVDHSVYQPYDRVEFMDTCGLPRDTRFFGFVGRNQIRKRFPEFIKAYEKAFQMNPKSMENCYLYFHCNWFDVGFDIHRIVQELCLESRVYGTYVCNSCGYWAPSKFIGIKSRCPVCSQNTFSTANVGNALSETQLARLYSSFWWYFQPAFREGFGIPVIEAKACGVPVSCTDYASLAELTRVGGLPIPVGYTVREDKSNMLNGFPSIEGMTDIMLKASEMSESDRASFSKAAIENSKLYTWDSFVDKWVRVIRRAKRVNPFIVPCKPSSLSGWTADNSLPDFVIEMYRKHLGVDVVAKTRGKPWLDPGYRDWMQSLRSKKQTREIVEAYFKEAAQGKASHQVPAVMQIESLLDSNDSRRVLVRVPRSYGDIILSTALVPGLREKFPVSTLYFAHSPPAEELVKYLRPDTKYITYTDILKERNIITRGVQGTSLFDCSMFPLVLSQTLHEESQQGYGRHILQSMADLCTVRLGCPMIQPEELPLDVASFLSKLGPYLVVHTGSGEPSKVWDLWRYLAEDLRFKVPVVQIGHEEDEVYPYNKIDFRGKLSWGRVVSVLQGGAAFLGADSVMAHLAAMAGLRSVVLFGSTHPDISGPLGGFIPLMPYNRRGCATCCFLGKCARNDKCINDISPEMVQKALSMIVPSITGKINRETVHLGELADVEEIHFYVRSLNDLEGYEKLESEYKQVGVDVAFVYHFPSLNTCPRKFLAEMVQYPKRIAEVSVEGPVPVDTLKVCRTTNIAFRIARLRGSDSKTALFPWNRLPGTIWSVTVEKSVFPPLYKYLNDAIQRKLHVVVEDVAVLDAPRPFPDGEYDMKGYTRHVRGDKVYPSKSDMLAGSDNVLRDINDSGWVPAKAVLTQYDAERLVVRKIHPEGTSTEAMGDSWRTFPVTKQGGVLALRHQASTEPERCKE